MLTTFPQCNFSLELPEILAQNHIYYHWLSVSGISKIMLCGILTNMPYYVGLSAHTYKADNSNEDLHHYFWNSTIAGKITKVVVEIRDCRQYIEEGIYESQVCGDSSMLAQFTMQNVLLNLMEGVNLSETIPILHVRTLNDKKST